MIGAGEAPVSTGAARNIWHGLKVHALGFFCALLLALGFRSLVYEPFHIPSGSMKPTLLTGDYIFVAKYAYGYSRYSFPWSWGWWSGRIAFTSPHRGDVVVFRYPANPDINYIKRLVGIPGDRVQMRDGVLYLNDVAVPKQADGIFVDDPEDGHPPEVLKKFIESIDDARFGTLDASDTTSMDTTPVYTVPAGHYFFLGDNRDHSRDSRFAYEVGFVPEDFLVGRAERIFFSSRGAMWPVAKFIRGIRWERSFARIR